MAPATNTTIRANKREITILWHTVGYPCDDLAEVIDSARKVVKAGS